MLKNIGKLMILGAMLQLTGCVQNQIITKQDAYPKMYEAAPKSILVVPAVNRSTAADAPDLYSTTIAQPLAEAGYYVMPIPLTNLLLQQEGITDGAQLREVNPAKFRQLMGADTVLFVTINQWDTNYFVTGGNVTVGAEFDLVDTNSGETLWNYHNIVVHNTSGNSGNLLADIIATAITTATTDYVPIAHIVNQQVISTLPVGQYHKRHRLDGTDATVNQQQLKGAAAAQ
jgi:hypothetical protein